MIDPSHSARPPHPEADARDSLRRVVDSLRRRAWRIHGGTALFVFLAGALLLAALTAVALGLGAPEWVRWPALALTAVGAAAAAAWAWERAARPTDAALARRLESRDPRAAGLATAVQLAELLPLAEGQDLGEKPFSPELARAHVAETAARVEQAGPEKAFDERPLRRAAAAAGGSLALLAVAALVADPVAEGLGRLAFGDGHAKDPRAAPRVAPITGDIALTYLYPAHTGLPPRTVEGTNGAIDAPVGTQVRIETRADRDLAQAFIDVDGASLPMEVKGRQLTGTLLVTRSGSYRFRFADERGRDIAVGPEIPINAALDGAPAVDILAPIAELTVTETEGVELQFEATDDHGVAKVELVFSVGSGPEQVVGIGAWGEPRRRASGSWVWELGGLQLRPGDRITYYLRATDNDAVGGAKQGQSRTQVLTVFSQAEHRRALVAKVEEAWEKMVLALGDRIAPREGPRAVRREERIEAGAPADEQVLEVGTTLADVAAELRKDENAPQELTAALINISQNVLEKSRVTRSVRAKARSAPRLVAELDRAEGLEQQELERSVLYLEALLDRQRILQIEELAREMASSRRELTSLMEQYREAPSDAAKQEILRELARLRERMRELMQRMAELSKGIQDEHLNAEAMKAMAEERDLASGLDQIEKLLGEGKIDEAMAKLQELGMQMDEMAKALSEAADSQAENDPALRQLAEDLQKYEQQLDQVAAEQQEIAKSTEELRREQARELQAQLQREGGEALVDELQKKVERAQQALEKLPADVPMRLSDDLGGAKERLENLKDALAVEDFDAAMESAAQALAHAENLERTLDRELGYARQFDLPERQELEAARGPTAEATPLVREVKEKLEELFANPSQRMSQQQRRQLEQLAQRQEELGRQMAQLQQQAEQIRQQAPIFDEAAQAAMEGAQRSMGEASQQLRGRNPGGALASERQAQEQLRTLKQGLEQARQQARGNRGAGGGFPLPLASGGRGGQRGSGGDFNEREKVAIPSADQYKAPDEFRKDILDAMKQDAPAGFKEHVREYYEEIVK